MKRLIAAASTLAFVCAAHAQSASAPLPSSPAKKELVQKLIALQQTGLEGMGRNLAEQPARQMLAAADNVLQTRVAADKREAAATQIRAYLRKYLDEAEPLVRERAVKVGQASLGPLFEEKFTEEELRQLLAALDAPAYKKFQQVLPDFSNAYVQKLVAELRPVLDPKLKTLEQNVATALGVTPSPAASAPATAAKPAAPAASRPAKK
jgi:hypothetical protein